MFSWELNILFCVPLCWTTSVAQAGALCRRAQNVSDLQQWHYWVAAAQVFACCAPCRAHSMVWVGALPGCSNGSTLRAAHSPSHPLSDNLHLQALLKIAPNSPCLLVNAFSLLLAFGLQPTWCFFALCLEAIYNILRVVSGAWPSQKVTAKSLTTAELCLAHSAPAGGTDVGAQP